jgi:hypothetical protein
MATTGFDTYYGDHPWEGMSLNQRSWYVPDLINEFRSRSLFRPFVPVKVDFRAQNTATMIFNLIYGLEPNITPLNNRDLWLPSQHFDSAQISLTLESHGGKVAFHEWDDLITYWKLNGSAGLRRICAAGLSQSMVDHLDLLARNALLSSPYKLYTDNSAATGFNSLTSSNLFNLTDAMDIWLGMSYRNLPIAVNPTGPQGAIVCITSPGVIFDIQNQAGEEWRAINTYSEAGRAALLKYEVGMYKNVRFLSHPLMTLWNAGTWTQQLTVTVAASAGDGAAATVDSVYAVGQSDATAYVQCSAFTADEFAVNDILTIHTSRTTNNGVINGVDYVHGKTCSRRVVTVDADNNRLSFDKPLLQDYETDLGSGVYAYVTKGLHIHASLFMAGPEGVVCGVTQPPVVMAPPVVDDLMAMYRFSWKARLKYQLFRPEMLETIFSAGNVRFKGSKTTGG